MYFQLIHSLPLSSVKYHTKLTIHQDTTTETPLLINTLKLLMSESDEYVDVSTVELNTPSVSDEDNSVWEDEWEEELDDEFWNWYWALFFYDITWVWAAAVA